jgi:hypothetical protein
MKQLPKEEQLRGPDRDGLLASLRRGFSMAGDIRNDIQEIGELLSQDAISTSEALERIYARGVLSIVLPGLAHAEGLH